MRFLVRDGKIPVAEPARIMTIDPVLQLKCSCNQYSWGKKGSASLAARLCEKTPGWAADGLQTDFRICENNPYPGMWMGTYPALSSYIVSSGEDLQSMLDKHPDRLIGRKVIEKFGHTKLPYLPKVLSFAKALTLQILPDKALAAQLHEKDPTDFTDPNHKPEIAIAIENSKFGNQTLKDIVRAMLTADDNAIRSTCEDLCVLDKTSFGDDSYVPDLIPRLADEFDQTDPGILVALITMNYLVLQLGGVLYIPADGIHAYLAGDIIECMARSNNILNSGFCPKAERASAELFCSSLTSTPHSALDCILRSEPCTGSGCGKTRVYKPPVSEFNMIITELSDGEKEILAAVAGPSISVATRGAAVLKVKDQAWIIGEGNVFFVAQGTEVALESMNGLAMYTTYVE